MLNKKLLAQFREIRKKHPDMNTGTVFRWAKGKLAAAELKPLEWTEVKHSRHDFEECRFIKKGFQIIVTKSLDDCPPDYPGTFSNKYKPGAIDHHARAQLSERERWNTLQWFHPVNTEESHRRGLQAMGYSRGEGMTLARKYVLEDYKRACSYGDDWQNVNVSALALRLGVELGSASCGGIESDSGDYFDEVARDLADEAISGAEKTLKKLCECSN